LIFLLDNNFPPQLAKALELLDQEDCQYRHSAAVFGAAAPDELLFAGVKERGWFLVTQDAQMSRKPAERQAILQSGIGVFVFTGRAERTFREIAAFVLARTSEMIEYARRTKPPFICSVPDRGKLKRLDR
jgi:hypothetical protein